MAKRDPDERMYKIGEVCRLADVQPYVLRYWETEFPPLAPNKSGGGQRLYTQRDVDIILRIKQLLYSEGFTIAGAKKRLEGELAHPETGEPAASPKREDPAPEPGAADTQPARVSLEARERLRDVQRELKSILALLRK